MTNNLRIAHKLWLSVLALIVLLVAVVGFAAYRSSKSQAQADAVTRELASRVESALKWHGLTETNAARTLAMIVSSDPAVAVEFKDVIAATSAQISHIDIFIKNVVALELNVTFNRDTINQIIHTIKTT